MADARTPEEAKVDRMVLAFMSAYEHDMPRMAKAIWEEATAEEKELMMIGAVAWLRGCLEDIERRGGPTASNMIMSLAAGDGV